MPTLDSTDIQKIACAARGYLHVFYVSTTGNDSNDGHTAATALATVNYACSLAGAADLIKLLPGLYTESGPLTLTASVEGSGIYGTQISVTDDSRIYSSASARFSDVTFNAAVTFDGQSELVRVRILSSTTCLRATTDVTMQDCECINVSDGTNGITLMGLRLEGAGVALIRNSRFFVDARGYSSLDAVAVRCAGQVTLLENCHLQAINADNTNVALLHASADVVLVGCRVQTVAGVTSGLMYDVSFESGSTGSVSYMSSNISAAKVEGGVASLLPIDANAATISGMVIPVDTLSGGLGACVLKYADGQKPQQQLAGYGPGGGVAVNHDTGGVDNLRVIAGGVGVSGAVLRAYLAGDWATSPLTAVLLASTATGSDGRWITPIYLMPGYTYTIVADKPGVFTPRVLDVSV